MNRKKACRGNLTFQAIRQIALSVCFASIPCCFFGCSLQKNNSLEEGEFKNLNISLAKSSFQTPVNFATVKAFNNNKQNSEAFIFRRKDHIEIVMTKLHIPATHPGTPLPVSISRFYPAIKKIKKISLNLKMTHPRHALSYDANNDQKQDIFLVGHGTDVHPFPGESSYLLLQNDDSYEPILIGQPAFTFFTAIGNLLEKNKKIVYLSNSGNHELPGPQLVYFDQNKLLQYKFSLPKKIASRTQVFLASHFADLDNDGIDELILGGHDGNYTTQRSTGDSIFKFDINASTWKETSLNQRIGGETWGTVDIKSVHLNNDSLLDLVTVSHNHGFYQGGLQIHINQGNLKFNTNSHTYKSWANKRWWIPWIVPGDINKDGLTDLLFITRHNGPSETELHPLLLINLGSKGFIDVSKNITWPEKNIINGLIDDENLYLITYSGELLTAKLPIAFADGLY